MKELRGYSAAFSVIAINGARTASHHKIMDYLGFKEVWVGEKEMARKGVS